MMHVLSLLQVLLRCEVCKCEINGVVPAASHLAGSKHQKAYKRYLAKLSDENGTRVLDDNKHRDTFVAEGWCQLSLVLQFEKYFIVNQWPYWCAVR